MRTVSEVEQGQAVEAIAVGALARRLLVAGCRGTVEAVLKSIVYLSTAGGELVWLTADGQVPHRRYVRVRYRLPEIEPGMAFVAQGGALWIGGGVRIETTQAACWSPAGEQSAAGLTRVEARARFRALRATVQDMPQPVLPDEGRLNLAVGCPQAWTAASLPPCLGVTSAVAERLWAACRARNLSDVLEAGLELVGLGPGFTPAGDDYLGGLLFTLYHLQRASTGVRSWDEERVADFLTQARRLTGWVSHVILSDLARGHGPGPLHDLVGSMFDPAPASDLAVHADRLCRIGHSSGRDMLAGVLAAAWATDGYDGGTE
jgi:hypothetical protein